MLSYSTVVSNTIVLFGRLRINGGGQKREDIVVNTTHSLSTDVRERPTQWSFLPPLVVKLGSNPADN
jgi:hypothetical protein